jgi:hypothetical protein
MVRPGTESSNPSPSSADADYAPTNQNIFFLGNRMPEKVPDSAIKFYEDRFVNLWRFADEQLAKTQYLRDAQRATAIIPLGQIIDSDKPDAKRKAFSRAA